MKRLPLVLTLVAVGLVVLIVAAVGITLYATSSPAFFSRYSTLARRYDSLQTSVHRGLSCSDCHIDQRGPAAYRLALVGDFYRSLFSKQSAPAYVQFANPTRAACLACHRGAWSFSLARTSKVPHPAHLRVSTEKRDCVTCHKWTAHEEVYMEKHKSMPFSGVCVSFGCHVGYKQPEQCSTCHHTLRPDTEWLRVHPQAVASIGPNACLEKCHDAAQCRLCHTTGKKPVFTGLTAQSGTKAIETLHASPDWVLQLHGPEALADPSKCLICHVSEVECQDCHAQRPAFHGSTATWIGAHQKVGTNKPRCLECHRESWCTKCHDQFKAMR
jgi:nitrate/TMAO reductase-like tetraheme cytochrome c subunit